MSAGAAAGQAGQHFAKFFAEFSNEELQPRGLARSRRRIGETVVRVIAIHVAWQLGHFLLTELARFLLARKRLTSLTGGRRDARTRHSDWLVTAAADGSSMRWARVQPDEVRYRSAFKAYERLLGTATSPGQVSAGRIDTLKGDLAELKSEAEQDLTEALQAAGILAEDTIEKARSAVQNDIDAAVASAPDALKTSASAQSMEETLGEIRDVLKELRRKKTVKDRIARLTLVVAIATAALQAATWQFPVSSDPAKGPQQTQAPSAHPSPKGGKSKPPPPHHRTQTQPHSGSGPASNPPDGHPRSPS